MIRLSIGRLRILLKASLEDSRFEPRASVVSEGDWMPSGEMVILTDSLGTDPDLNGRHLNMPDCL